MNQIKIVSNDKVQLLSPNGDVLAEATNCTLRFLYANGIAPTLEEFLALDYLGDVSSLEDVGPEDRAEIEELIEDGFLLVSVSKFKN